LRTQEWDWPPNKRAHREPPPLIEARKPFGRRLLSAYLRLLWLLAKIFVACCCLVVLIVLGIGVKALLFPT
jgi:hypothetical protein